VEHCSAKASFTHIRSEHVPPSQSVSVIHGRSSSRNCVRPLNVPRSRTAIFLRRLLSRRHGRSTSRDLVCGIGAICTEPMHSGHGHARELSVAQSPRHGTAMTLVAVARSGPWRQSPRWDRPSRAVPLNLDRNNRFRAARHHQEAMAREPGFRDANELQFFIAEEGTRPRRISFCTSSDARGWDRAKRSSAALRRSGRRSAVHRRPPPS